MTPILVHYALTLDMSGYPHTQETVDHFIEQASLSAMEKSVEMFGDKCTIRFTISGSETLPELQEAAKHIPTGLFSDSLKSAVKSLKVRPDDIYLELNARLPLFGEDEQRRNS